MVGLHDSCSVVLSQSITHPLGLGQMTDHCLVLLSLDSVSLRYICLESVVVEGVTLFDPLPED